jgi:hypothetical protein
MNVQVVNEPYTCRERVATNGTIPITVKIEIAGRTISVHDGGPSKNVSSGANIA